MDKISTFTLPSCAVSFACPPFTCHPRAAWGAECVFWAWVPLLLEDEDAPVKIIFKNFGREIPEVDLVATLTEAFVGSRKRPLICTYAPARSLKLHPRAPPPEPRLNRGPCSSLPGV